MAVRIDETVEWRDIFSLRGIRAFLVPREAAIVASDAELPHDEADLASVVAHNARTGIPHSTARLSSDYSA